MNDDFEKNVADDSVKETDQVNTEDIKKEATDTLSQAKDVIKNINIKEDAEAAKGFFADMIKNPLGKMKEIGSESSNFFRIAVIILLVWTAAVLAGAFVYIIDVWEWMTFSFRNIFDIFVMPTIAPVIKVIIMAAIVFIIGKKQIKSITPVIVVITIANSPLMISAILNILPRIISGSGNLISPLNSFLSVISIIFVYFGIKGLMAEENDEEFFTRFVLIQCCYFVARFLLGFLQISI
jgi:hypothetical protein